MSGGGHYRTADPGMTQNQGNVLGDRPCVRQSRLYREQIGGNAMKDIMGQSDLKWNTTQQQGAYGGRSVYDHNTEDGRAVKTDSTDATIQRHGYIPPPQQQQQQQQGYNNNNNNGNNNNNNGNNNMQRESPGAPRPSGEGTSVSTGKAMRPGAGYANRQTYNIFTGQ